MRVTKMMLIDEDRNKEETNGFLEYSASVSNTEPKQPTPLNLSNEGLNITPTPDVFKVKNTKNFVRKMQMGVDSIFQHRRIK